MFIFPFFQARANKQLKNEYRACLSVLKRSGLIGSAVNVSRGFHTTGPFCKKNNKDGNKNNDNEDDNKKIPALFTKFMLWVLSGYMIVGLLSLIFPTTNQPEVINQK